MALDGDSAEAQNRALAPTGHVDIASSARGSITGERDTECDYTDVASSARQFSEDSACRDLSSKRTSYDRSRSRR